MLCGVQQFSLHQIPGLVYLDGILALVEDRALRVCCLKDLSVGDCCLNAESILATIKIIHEFFKSDFRLS